MMIENLKYFFKVMNVPYQILHKKKLLIKIIYMMKFIEIT